MKSFKQYMLEMCEMAIVKTNTNRNYNMFSDEAFFIDQKNTRKAIASNLWFIVAKNENHLYVLSDGEHYVASIEIDPENTTTIDGKKVFWIDAGYSKVRGGYAKLLDSILAHTDFKFIMSDLSLSDRAAKFWSKYVDAVDSSKYKPVIYDTKTKKLLPFDKNKMFSYDDQDDNGNEYNHIGIMK
jgi:hypothetical protein